MYCKHCLSIMELLSTQRILGFIHSSYFSIKDIL